MIHLDTSFLIRALVPGTTEDRSLRSWIGEGRSLTVSAVAWAEFRCGPLQPEELRLAEAILGRARDFTHEDAVAAARLYNESGRRRGSLADCMIAAAALGDGAVVATANSRDFESMRDSGVVTAQAK